MQAPAGPPMTPPAVSSIDDSDHWLRRAEEMRSFADKTDDFTFAGYNAEVATDYERLAQTEKHQRLVRSKEQRGA